MSWSFENGSGMVRDSFEIGSGLTFKKTSKKTCFYANLATTKFLDA